MTAQSLIANAKAIVTQKYFCFEGRADRAEFWQFFLVVFIVNTVLGIVDSVIGIKIFSSLLVCINFFNHYFFSWTGSKSCTNSLFDS